MDDDQDIVGLLTGDLEEVGFSVRAVSSGISAIECYEEVDAIIMEARLPDIDGFQVCQRIRSRSHVPIIIHSVQSTEMDRVLGLKLGADDYVTKPCGTWELAARVESVVRRARGPEVAGTRGAVERHVVKVGPLSVDINQRRVEINGKEVLLTYKEFELLTVLIERPGDVVHRTEIMQRVWGYDGEGDTRTLGVHMVALRRKLAVPSLIRTVRGVGYRILA